MFNISGLKEMLVGQNIFLLADGVYKHCNTVRPDDTNLPVDWNNEQIMNETEYPGLPLTWVDPPSPTGYNRTTTPQGIPIQTPMSSLTSPSSTSVLCMDETLHPYVLRHQQSPLYPRQPRLRRAHLPCTLTVALAIVATRRRCHRHYIWLYRRT
eukprot:TRINITY_DN4341_c0_g1_i1.p1 TRINITY_DN4341_c0_g1~~TRINITY_DN4341_c0_g1_i1.p1  ORF type:complete len:154 (-),score=16.69 TRINITY_DN4341_c0_g1_i1:82-543(-)